MTCHRPIEIGLFGRVAPGVGLRRCQSRSVQADRGPQAHKGDLSRRYTCVSEGVMLLGQMTILSAWVEVGVTLEQARAWFLSLRENPHRYRFATHEGFVFTEGDFGRPGARFYTVERFGGLRQRLWFELTAVGEASFEFILLKPLNGQIWGAFALTPTPSGTSLTLSVGVRTPLGARTSSGARFLRFWPIRVAVQRQIIGEVRHIKASMEALYARPTACR